MRAVRAFEVKFLPSTDTLGARVQVKDLLWSDKPKVTLPFDYKVGDLRAQAAGYLSLKGIDCESYTAIGVGTYLLLTDNLITDSDL